MQEDKPILDDMVEAAKIQKEAFHLADNGRAEEGMALLEKGAKEYPENKALFTFGMVYMYSEKKHLDNYRQHQEDWARIWAEQGQNQAALMLGSLYGNKKGMGKEALAWLEKALDSPNKDVVREAACRMGKIYLHGDDHVPVDGDKAETFFQKAADMGSAQGMYLLSGLYDEDVGLKPDQAKSREWLQKAAKAGNGDACYKIAVPLMMNPHLHTRKGKIEAIKKALPLFEKGAKADHGGCCFALGMIYLYGQGVRQDAKKGIRFLEMAASLGSTEALMCLAKAYKGDVPGLPVKKNAAKAEAFLKKAAAAGNMYAAEELGLSFILGKGVRKAPKEGMEYLERALRDGSSWAGFMMAVAYLGRDGIPQNLLKAEEYLRRTIFMNGPASDDAREVLEQLKNKNWADLPTLRDMRPLRDDWENQSPLDGMNGLSKFH